jgi:predicted MFS family arabinose efflux permease
MLAIYSASLARAVTWLGILIYLGSFLRHTYNLNEHEIGMGYLILGAGYFAGSLAAGGRFMSISLRPLYGVTSSAMAVMLIATMTLRLGVLTTLAMLAVATAVGGASYVCLTTLMVNESHAGRSTTMALNSAVFSLGTAGGAAVGGALIAVSGYSALAIGLAGSAIVSALLVWNPLQRDSLVVPAESTL